MLNVALCQINTTPNRFKQNFELIVQCLKIANEHSNDIPVDLVVFPELTIPGYLSKDLVYTEDYIRNNKKYLNLIIEEIDNNFRDLYDSRIVVGYFDINPEGIGKPFTNRLAVIHRGIIEATYTKHLLPFYDVFDEARYCEPGKDHLVINIDGHKVGFTICEDLWNDKLVDNYAYADNPIEYYRNVGCDTIVNISSSPFVQEKPNFRQHMIEEISKDKKLTIIYCNQQGGQDDLYFDGRSTIVMNGMTHLIMDPTANDIEVEFHTTDKNNWGHFISNIRIKDEMEYLFNVIVNSLRDYIHKSGFKSIVLGSSGGIDSALVAALAKHAIGGENVHCIMMPSKYSSDGSVNDAKELHRNIGCNEYEMRIDPADFYVKFKQGYDNGILTKADIFGTKEYTKHHPSADENLQARMRALNVMYFSNGFGALALTTGNKTELATGYFTLYGDSCGGYAPLKDLYKMQIFEMAKWINKKFGPTIPENIINKAPSAELAPDQTDEESLLPYPILDRIVKYFIEYYVTTPEGFKRTVVLDDEHSIDANYQAAIAWMKTDSWKAEYKRIIDLINRNEFKRQQAAPGIKLSKVSFGSGRRVPIVK